MAKRVLLSLVIVIAMWFVPDVLRGTGSRGFALNAAGQAAAQRRHTERLVCLAIGGVLAAVVLWRKHD
jgi:apolipoprotein N-acyltransferase